MNPGRLLLALLVILSLTAGPAPGPAARAAEPPPAQGTRLHFEKTLSVQRTETGKVFAETRQIAPGENLWQILSREYGIREDALPSFLRAFRDVNPGVDPDRLAPGQVVRVPFKVEEGIPRPQSPAAAPPSYTVQAGDSLWRILRDRFAVSRERMTEALDAVARANPGIRDLNRLYVGQRLLIPRLPGAPAPEAPAGSAALPASFRTALDLLRELGCRVVEEGETFLPLSRGRTLRLEARDFPVVVGPAGGKVILDPRSRLSPALVRSVRDEWGYRCVAGASPDPEAYLAEIVPHLGFYEVGEGERAIPLGGGAELVAQSRWTVVPRPEDLWEGKVHLLFPPGSALDPRLVRAARRAGFASHPLGSTLTAGGGEDPGDGAPSLAELPMADPAEGAARVLALLGIPHRVRPEVECDLGGGVRYRLTPLLTLRVGGLDYAVPPASPARAEAMLTRAGYFTIPWAADAAPLNILGDLLSLLGVPHARTTVEAPPGQALRLRVSGIALEETRLAGLLYPGPASGRLLLIEARVPAPVAAALIDQGFLPWLIR